jgi:hypothetical protein
MVKIHEYLDDQIIYSYGIPDLELHNCPYCKGKGALYIKEVVYAYCSSCKAQGPSHLPGIKDEGKIMASKEWNAGKSNIKIK